MFRTMWVQLFLCCLTTAAFAADDTVFSVTVRGHFQRMLHSGDASGKVALDSIPPTEGLYGLGALAGLHGEVIVWDGRVLVTPGESVGGGTRTPGPGEQAALLITSQVDEWHATFVPQDMSRQEFEGFVVEQARAQGIDVEQPFPFLVLGVMTDYTWHVVTGQANRHGAGSGHQLGHAQNRVFSGAEAQGKLFGMYSAAQLEGVITHPGERFHVHFTNNDLTISGHVDSYGIRRGTTLLLPRPKA